MPLPIVAIVGRPNVGKSSLFNTLANRRISIVDPIAGVTRDRVSTLLEYEGRHFELVDTGGMGIQDIDNLTEDVERQIQNAIETAAVVLFLVDIRVGVTPLDQTVAERLRSIGRPVIFVANKADDSNLDNAATELYRLGYGPPLLVSANSRRGKEDLIYAIIDKLPLDTGEAPDSVELKLAIVGRRNVGKSTFINSLAEEERVIVSEVAGTTRDSIDVRFERDGKTFIAIDTAGVRKKSSMSGNVEFYSLHRAERSIRRADVVLHFFDARTRVGRVDKQLAEYIIENHKPAIFVVNKWDLVMHAMETEKMAKYLRDVFPMLDHVPIAFVTAKQGKNTIRLLNLAQQLYKQAGQRLGTGELNRILKNAFANNVPPVRFNRVAKVYYAAQVAVFPPTIAMVTNGPELFDNTYTKYLTKVLRDTSPFGEVPIKMIYRAKNEGGKIRGKPGEVEDLAVDLDGNPIPDFSGEIEPDEFPPPPGREKAKPARTKVKVAAIKEEPADPSEKRSEPRRDNIVNKAPSQRIKSKKKVPKPKKPGVWDI